MDMKSSASFLEKGGSPATSFSTSYAGVVAFITVASEGSFARAGDRLGIGRSAVSRSVRKLEDQLDVRLFVRTTRNTSLTKEGERFLEQCQPSVERIERSLEEMRDLREGPPQGGLRICAPWAFGRLVVMPLLEGFRAQYPGVIVELSLDERVVDFTSSGIDVAFRSGIMEDSQIVAKKLVPMELICCASVEYAQSRGLPLAIEDIREHQCINYRKESGRMEDWEFKVDGQARKMLPDSAYTFNDLELVTAAVLAGQGIAQLPAFLISEHLRSGRLVAFLANRSPDDRGHYICYLSRQHLPSRIRVFIDYVTPRIRSLDRQYVVSPMRAGGAQPVDAVVESRVQMA